MKKNKKPKVDTSDYYTDVFSKGKKLEKIYDKNGKKIEIEGENIIEKFFNIIAILWMDTPVGIILSIALIILFALIVGGTDGGPDFFTDTK